MGHTVVDDGRAPASPSAAGALGRILGSIAASTFELRPTLDQIAEEARVLCQADGCFCFVRDGDVLRPGGSAEVTTAYWEWLQENPLPVDAGSTAGRAVLSGEPARIADVTVEPGYTQREANEIGGYRSVTAVPIRFDGVVIGGFAIGRLTVAPFDDEAVALASVLADQAGLAIRIAQLLATGQQAQDREQSLAQVLATIGRGSFDLIPTLQAIVEESARLCDATVGNITIRDGEVYRMVAFIGFDADFQEMQSHQIYRPGTNGIVARTLLEQRVVTIADVLADPDYTLTELQRIGGYRTVLGVPIGHEGEILGTIALGRPEVRPFSKREISLIEAFASQVAIALRVADLLTATHDALERETAVGDVLQAIARSRFDLDHVLQTIIDSAVRLSHADEGNIARGEDGRFRMAAFTDGVSDSFREMINRRPFIPERGSVTGRALMDLLPLQVADVLADPEFAMHEAALEGGLRTVLSVPMLHDGVPIGTLSVWRTEVRPFSEPEIGLLRTFADQAALAISNVSLFETIERQRTELARFAPEVAGMLATSEGQQLLAGHRREISALFCDLRGFTAFTETAEPEELFDVLRQYHAAVGEIAIGAGGTVEHFAGDGLLVFFNDPTPLPDHQLAAVRAACAMRERFADLAAAWRKRGYELGLGVGIAAGYATLGRIGFEGRYDYAAIGPVVNLASRLSDVAAAGEVLINQRCYAAVEDQVEAEPVDGLDLKGLRQQTSAYRVLSVRP